MLHVAKKSIPSEWTGSERTFAEMFSQKRHTVSNHAFHRSGLAGHEAHCALDGPVGLALSHWRSLGIGLAFTLDEPDEPVRYHMWMRNLAMVQRVCQGIIEVSESDEERNPWDLPRAG